MSKATTRSPAGRPNPAPAKAEVNKLAGQGKDKMETRQVQDKIKDGMQVKNATKDGNQVQTKTMDGKQVQNKDGTQEAKDILNKTETKQPLQDNATKDGTQGKPAQDSTPGKDATLMHTEHALDHKAAVPASSDVGGDLGVRNPILNTSPVKDTVNAADTKEQEVKSTDKGTAVQVKINEKVTKAIDTGLLNEAISKETKDKASEEGQGNRVQKNIDKITAAQNVNVNSVDKTNEPRREMQHETSDKVKAIKDSPQVSHQADPKHQVGGKITGDYTEQTKQASQTKSLETEKPHKLPVIEDDDDDDDDDRQTESEKENTSTRQKSSNPMQNGHSQKKTDKQTRTRQRRNEMRRKKDEDEDTDDIDSGDTLAMDNELVRHLLPHMSPALLPKAMKSIGKARDSSSNSSEDEQAAQTKKLSLNVIKESSEGSDDNNTEEDSDEESEAEPPPPPPTAASSLRRHSFHHFPAPPTKSQSKNAEKVRALLQAVEEEELEKISKKLGEKTNLVKQHLGHVENRLFEMFGDEEKRTININKFLMGLTATGMRPSDPRLKQTKENLKKLQDQLGNEFVSLDIDYETFMGIISENLEIVVKAFSASFVIPDFQGFCKQIEEIYNTCFTNHSGSPAQYIPQLARYSSKSWGMSVCTVDGQRFSLGDVEVPFTIQSCSKPLTYAIGLAVNGCDYMHNYVGMEPSGRYFNELVLDYSSE